MYLIVIYVILTGLNSAYFLRVYIKHEAYVIFCNLKKNEIGARLPQPGTQFHIRPPDGAAIQKQFFFQIKYLAAYQYCWNMKIG